MYIVYTCMYIYAVYIFGLSFSKFRILYREFAIKLSVIVASNIRISNDLMTVTHPYRW